MSTQPANRRLMRRVAWLWAWGVLLCASACLRPTAKRPSPPPKPFAVARRAEAADLIPGLAAAGQPGDYLLANDHIQVIIADIPHRCGGSKSGGNIIDACDRRTRVDLLNEVFTYFDDTFPRQAVYTRIGVTAHGSESEAAAIQADGVDCINPGIKVTTTYQLAPGKRFVVITTTVTNQTGAGLKSFGLGDAIQWGGVEPFALGIGHALAGRRPRLEWLASTGPGVSYGMFVKTGVMETRHGASWSDVVVASPDIAAGCSVSYRRCFVVGRGGSTDISDAAYETRESETCLLDGRFVAGSDGSPVVDGELDIADMKGRVVGIAKTDAYGRFAAKLPPGTYRVTPRGRHRPAVHPFVLDLPRGKAVCFTGQLGDPARIKLYANDETGAPVPAKFTFQGRRPTPDPDFGLTCTAAGARNVVFSHTGRAETPITPGYYLVTASRGIEYTAVRKLVFVQTSRPAEAHFTLERVVRTPGYVAADLDQHAAPSFDCITPLADRVIADVCEGVEVVAATDHDVRTDLRPVIERLGLDARIHALVGNEVSTDSYGRFSVYPVPYLAHEPRHGAIDHAGKSPAKVFAELRRRSPNAIIQVNHPRAGNMGYFNRCKLSTKTGRAASRKFSLDFDAIQIVNGKHLISAQQTLKDWFNMLNLGHRFTALGSSDSHVLVMQEAGCPRTLLFVGVDAPDRVTDAMVAAAIKGHRAIVTNGPVIEFTVNGKTHVGETTTDTDGTVQLDLRVLCAPWVRPDRLDIVRNGAVVDTYPIPPVRGVVRLEQRALCTVERDSWFVVVVSGGESLAPVIPPMGSLDVTPFAVTNPIWIDADGDGKFTPQAAKP